MWTYRAKLIRWVDGDTCDVDIDLGFNVRHTHRLRLLGVDTPERSQLGWSEATAYAKANCPEGGNVIIKTEKADSFNRYLAEVFYVDPQDGVAAGSINDSLLSSGNAVPYIK